MKRKKAALFDPYLDVLGGGEKHIFSILKVLQEQNYEISVFWDRNLQKQIEQQFSLEFKNKIKFIPNIFSSSTSRLIKLLTLKNYDLFFYVTDGSYFFSSAKKTFIFAMVPQENLYRLNPMNRLKVARSHFITNSQFTQSWLEKWGIRSQLLYPYINDDFLNRSNSSKPREKIILSVGRFYRHLHAKRQDILIQWFKKMKHAYPLFKEFKLILAGGLRQEDKDYYNLLKKNTREDPSIELRKNVSYGELVDLYNKSLAYVHIAGLGVNQIEHPEQVEHLGIAPLEAMASGCITFCFNAGGPKEIIREGSTGFLFNNAKELVKKIERVVLDPTLQSKIQKESRAYIINTFSYSVFKKNVLETVL